MVNIEADKKYLILQANLQRMQLATHELIMEGRRRKATLALLQEPYVGGSGEMGASGGVRIYQSRSGGDGVVKASIAVFDDSIDAVLIPDLSSTNVTVVRLSTAAWVILVASVYFEPSQPLEPYLEIIKSICGRTGQFGVLLGGDVNAKSPWWGSPTEDRRGEELLGLLIEQNLQVLNQGCKPTFDTVRGGRHITSHVDITTCSESLSSRIEDWRVDEGVTCSDHNAITFKLTMKESKGISIKRTTRLYNTRKANWQLFNNKLGQLLTENLVNSVGIDNITDTNDLDRTVDQITSFMKASCEESIPKKKAETFNSQPWWSDELRLLKKTASTLKRRVRNAAPIRRPAVVAEYLKAKEEYINEAKRAQVASWKEFCHKQDRESVWSGIYRIISRTAKRTEDLLLTKEGATLTAEESAQYMAETFYPTDRLDEDNAFHTHVRETASKEDVKDQEETRDPPFTRQEMMTAINSLNPKKAPGGDGLTADICRRAIGANQDTFLSLANSCLGLGYFPRSWKEAVVVILRKSGKDDYTKPKSHRPIGLLPVMGKVLEKMVVARLNWHLTPGIHPRQYGFMPQRSTEDALGALVGRLRQKLSEKKLVAVVSLDIEGAFDGAWWPAIRVRLAESECPAGLRRLLGSYLSDRHVRVRYAGAEIRRSTSKGCVQGSISGPILWNLLLDPLLHDLNDRGSYTQAFADDIVIVVDGDTASEVAIKGNAALAYVREWGVKNKLKFAPLKTNAMIVTRKLKYDVPLLTMGGVDIPFSRELKILGVILDDRLSFGSHVAQQSVKALSFYRQLTSAARASWGLQPEIVKMIYRAAVEPLFTYAASVWEGATDRIGIQKKLNSVQRGFAQSMCKAHRTVSLHAALILSGTLPLELRVKEAAALYNARRGRGLGGIYADRELERPVDYLDTHHPARHIEVKYQCLEEPEEVASALPPNEPHIYTDGSKVEGAVGAAMTWWENGSEIRNEMYRLEPFCTVFQAELYAIHRAVELVKKKQIFNATILSDSRSSLDALSSQWSLNPIVKKTHETLEALASDGVRVTFFWLRAHVGTPGNERADELAKKAALYKKTKADYGHCPVSHVKRHIRCQTIEEWQRRHGTSTTGTITRIFFPDVRIANKILKNLKLNRDITRVLTGHGAYAAYLHRFGLNNSPGCVCDDEVEETVLHVVFECPRFDRQRFELEMCTDLNLTIDSASYLLTDLRTRQQFLDYMVKISSIVGARHKTQTSQHLV